MKKISSILLISVLTLQFVAAQSGPKMNLFPQGTILKGNIPYANDTLKKHLLDIYLPNTNKASYPVIIWVHGGAWRTNDKYADMSYMSNTLKAFIDSGYAVASIDYRHSTTAPFPAQIQDCNRAVAFLYSHAAEYNLDKSRVALIGFSAGGHLASLLALSNDNKVKDFYKDGKPVNFKLRMVLDFYGPSDFLADNKDTDPKSAVNQLLGAVASERPDLAKKASPATYVDKNDPPFLIVQGEKDESVNPQQSKNLSALLTRFGVKNELIIVPGAPHYGPMFDADFIRADIFKFLNAYMK